MTRGVFSCWMLVIAASLVSGQCPPNTAMGLCHHVSRPCFGDSDCFRGEICCPESCSRACKPMNGGNTVAGGNVVPDLLNDPRVYIGKCPEAACINMFSGEPNQCSTSNLCPDKQFCCNDGCKNVCQWTPEMAAKIAQEEARAKQHQQLIIQRQREEMARRQQDMHLQRQRQQAVADMARQQAEARAAAEAELAAQQARAKYEADLRAAAGAQANAVIAVQQRQAQLQAEQQRQQQLQAEQKRQQQLQAEQQRHQQLQAEQQRQQQLQAEQQRQQQLQAEQQRQQQLQAEQQRQQQLQAEQQRQQQLQAEQQRQQQLQAEQQRQQQLQDEQQRRQQLQAEQQRQQQLQAEQHRQQQLQVEQQRQQQQQQNQQSAPSSSTGSFLDNFGESLSTSNTKSGVSSPSQKLRKALLQYQQKGTKPNQPKANDTSKRDNLLGSLTNEINSPANANPYGPSSPQNINSKAIQEELLSLIHLEPPIPATQQDLQNVKNAYSMQSQASAFPTQAGLSPYSNQMYYPPQSAPLGYTSQTDGQMYAPSSNSGQRVHGSVVPVLMYHAIQTAA